MTVYEMKYFHPAKGTIGAKETKDIEVKMAVTASIFGPGQWIAIGALAGVAVLVLIAALVVRRKIQSESGKES